MAALVTLAWLMATTAAGGARALAAEPSTLAWASSLTEAPTVVPAAVTTTPAGRVALDEESTMFTATATATVTVPLGAVGAGVGVGLEGNTPLAEATLSPNWRWLATRAATATGGLPPPPATSMPPATESETVVEAPEVVKVTVPVAVTSRRLVADTTCEATVNASAVPTSASLPTQ